jgi:uridylate kinase
MGCDAILMGKNGVEGVYDSDPRKNKDARLLKELTYSEVLEKNLQVMDGTAVSLLRESNIIIRVFNMADPSNIVRAVKDPALGTVIHR